MEFQSVTLLDVFEHFSFAEFMVFLIKANNKPPVLSLL
jgi:hypothetical protein